MLANLPVTNCVCHVSQTLRALVVICCVCSSVTLVPPLDLHLFALLNELDTRAPCHGAALGISDD